MARKIIQFRWKRPTNGSIEEGWAKPESNNIDPISIETNKYSIETGTYNNIEYHVINCDNMVQIGIQSIPGTAFYFNANDPSYEQHMITVGNTGIYEINVDGFTTISSIGFPVSVMDDLNNINNGYIIVDVIYDDDKSGGAI